MATGFRINGRAKPGKGKQWYHGLNLSAIQARKAEIEDSGAASRANLKSLYQFTDLYLGRALDLTNADQKDTARNWVRFFNNSHLLDVLADSGFDVADLRKQLQEVSLACHPLNFPAFETDIEAIRFYLEEILLRLRAAEAGQGTYPGYPTLPDTFPQTAE